MLSEQPQGPLATALTEISQADPSGEAVKAVTEAIDGAEEHSVIDPQSAKTEQVRREEEKALSAKIDGLFLTGENVTRESYDLANRIRYNPELARTAINLVD